MLVVCELLLVWTAAPPAEWSELLELDVVEVELWAKAAAENSRAVASKRDFFIGNKVS